jgi:hypothetical protein
VGIRTHTPAANRPLAFDSLQEQHSRMDTLSVRLWVMLDAYATSRVTRVSSVRIARSRRQERQETFDAPPPVEESHFVASLVAVKPNRL